MALPHVIVITGPTASGKSSLAVGLAQKLGCDIISADSRQVYRGIPITTATPSEAEKGGVRHHLLDFLELDSYYSAATFAEDAMRIISEATTRHIIVCGGSMMYIDALLYGLDDLPTVSDEVRTRVRELYAAIGLDGMVAYLGNLDPETASKIDKSNPKRVVHAVELCLQSGRRVSELFSTSSRPAPFKFSKFAIRLPREELFDRINSRVRAMVDAGMEEEARSVLHLRHLNSLNTIGFKEWFAHFDGLMDRQTAIERIAKNTRVYAKKQMTWLARRNDTVYYGPTFPLPDF